MDAPATDHRRLFERLCLLRSLYARRGPRDRVGVISLAEALRYAEELFARSAESTV